MSTFKSLEEARAYFKGDRFATENGMTLDAIGEGTATCSLTLSQRHQNANGGVMGGVIFTLADFAFAAAVNNVHRPTVAQQGPAPHGDRPAAQGRTKHLRVYRGRHRRHRAGRGAVRGDGV